MEMKNDITDNFLDDDFQYAEWVEKHQEFIGELLKFYGNSSSEI